MQGSGCNLAEVGQCRGVSHHPQENDRSELKALICGSAPLNVETQHYFMMLGIPVLQVYGLTETTAICTMDDPRHVEPGRVGPAINGMEMKLGENDEIVVRGPNIFPGYWNRPQETAKVLRDGWFHTGDQGEVDAAGNWRIVGRIKNLIILGSGHNIAPEPIEDEVLQTSCRSAAGGAGGQWARISFGDHHWRCDARTGAERAGCGESWSAALQADPCVSYSSGTVFDRKWFADGEWKAEAGRDFGAVEE